MVVSATGHQGELQGNDVTNGSQPTSADPPAPGGSRGSGGSGLMTPAPGGSGGSGGSGLMTPAPVGSGGSGLTVGSGPPGGPGPLMQDVTLSTTGESQPNLTVWVPKDVTRSVGDVRHTPNATSPEPPSPRPSSSTASVSQKKNPLEQPKPQSSISLRSTVTNLMPTRSPTTTAPATTTTTTTTTTISPTTTTNTNVPAPINLRLEDKHPDPPEIKLVTSATTAISTSPAIPQKAAQDNKDSDGPKPEPTRGGDHQEGKSTEHTELGIPDTKQEAPAVGRNESGEMVGSSDQVTAPPLTEKPAGVSSPAAGIGPTIASIAEVRSVTPAPQPQLTPGPPRITRPTAPLVGKRRTDSQPDGILKTPNGKGRNPLEKIDVVTLSHPVDPAAPRGGLNMAAVLVPVICVLLIIVLVLGVFLMRRRRGHMCKRRQFGDEESSTDVTSALMTQEEPAEKNNSTSEPIYAIVDKSKKRRLTESVSITEESLLLSDLAPAVNGSCLMPEGSVDSLVRLGSAGRGDLGDEVFPTGRGDIGDEVFPQDEQGPLYDVPPCEGSLGGGPEGEEEGERGRGRDSEPAGLIQGPVREKDQSPDLTLVECDIYDSADRYDPSKDDEDGMYEIPDSPGTIRARRSMARFSALRPDSAVSENIAIPERATADTSDSGSDQDSDFEDMWNKPVTDVELGDGLHPPPVPPNLPDSDDFYLYPKCHKHCPPGPNWKPFHEYDPVYVPHSDPAAMNERVDNQNYVRGRQRSDSRVTNPYEEIQFDGIYVSVDDDDVDDEGARGNNPQDSNRQVNPIQLPPRMPPSPPPPLVPRRTRPISGVADIGRRSLQLPPDPEPPDPAVKQEPRYSGLIMDDVSDPEDETPHEYTPLEYTRLRSVGSGPLLDDDDIKPMDDTDSETYTKHSPAPIPTSDSMDDTDSKTYNKHSPAPIHISKPLGEIDSGTCSQLSPTLLPTSRAMADSDSETDSSHSPSPLPTSPDSHRDTAGPIADPDTARVPEDSDKGLDDSTDKAGILFSQGNSGVIVNGNNMEDYTESSEDSDDSYETFDFKPPE